MAVAAASLMARRIGALVAIAMLVALVVTLVWSVYQHHELMRVPDESAIVRLDIAPPSSVVIFAMRS